MRVRGLKSLRLAINWLHSRVTDFVLILGYHRVVKAAFDPYGLCVQPDHFAEHLEVLRQTANVIDLKTLQQGLFEGDLPQKAIVITFDDAYLDILQTVKPLLVAHGIPATIFVVTGTLGMEFWWDELARVVFSPAVLPNKLSMQIGADTITWTNKSSDHRKTGKENPNSRGLLLEQMYQMLAERPDERPSILTNLLSWAETATPVAAAIERTMTAAELQALIQDGLISVGSHTVTHPILTNIPQDQQYIELRESKNVLENTLSQPVTALSYPHGINDAQTQWLAQQAGFKLAFGSQNGIVHKNQNRLALPRFWVPDWDGEHFGRWLARWL
jgi:peptidoglycan/xylan/chitin deacetylase (PgdA/CDA1 family)